MASEKFRLLSIGPSLVDLSIVISDLHLQALCDEFNLSPGGWMRVNSFESFRVAFEICTQKTLLSDFSNFHALPQAVLTAGSTNFGFLSALDRNIREDSALLTAQAVSLSGKPSFLSTFFKSEIEKLSIAYVGAPTIGDCPVGLIVTSPSCHDRIILNYLGIANELEDSPREIVSDFLYVDVYEMKQGKIANFVINEILKENRKVILGLGSEAAIDDLTKMQILSLIENNRIHCLVGNQLEFLKLFGIESLGALRDFAEWLASVVPSFLMTLGKNGMIGSFGKTIHYQPANQIGRILNTSGAGDISAGVFVSGMILGEAIDSTLLEATKWASVIIARQESFLKNGRR